MSRVVSMCIDFVAIAHARRLRRPSGPRNRRPALAAVDGTLTHRLSSSFLRASRASARRYRSHERQGANRVMKTVLLSSLLVTFVAGIPTSTAQPPQSGPNEERAAQRIADATHDLDPARLASLADDVWEAHRERATDRIRREVTRYMQSDIVPSEPSATVEAKVRAVLRSHHVDSECRAWDAWPSMAARSRRMPPSTRR